MKVSDIMTGKLPKIKGTLVSFESISLPTMTVSTTWLVKNVQNKDRNERIEAIYTNVFSVKPIFNRECKLIGLKLNGTKEVISTNERLFDSFTVCLANK